MPAFLGIFLSKLLAGVMAFVSCILNPFAVLTNELPVAPDDFNPVLRFAVASDVHFNEDQNDDISEAKKERYKAFLAKAEELAKNSSYSYKGLDAIFIAGDFADNGYDSECALFGEYTKNYAPEGVPVYIVMGNHDMFCKDGGTTATKETKVRRFEEILGQPLDWHYEIKGIHFIGVSYDAETSYKQRIGWLDDELKTAVKADKTKPVFVFMHPHPAFTVYGSVNWGDYLTPLVYSKYKQTVVFSGHSHYPINDPRSLWQGSYTSIGTGALSYFELEKDCVAGQFPDGYKNAAQFRLVEVDAEGNTKVTNYDLITDSFFPNEYYLTDFDNRTKFAYTSRNMKARSERPVFPDGATASGFSRSGEEYIAFKAATDKDIVHDYKVTISKSSGLPVWSGSVMSHYYLLGYGDVETISLGDTGLDAGTYKLTVRAQNAYGKVSDAIEGTIEITDA